MTDHPSRLPTLLALGVVAAVLAGCEGTGRRDRTPAVAPDAAVERAQAQAANQSSQAAKPSKHYCRVGQYVFYSDEPLDAKNYIFRDLEALPEQIERELQLPVGSTVIQVYLFEDEEKYHAFLRAKDPSLPLRSAYFFAEPSRGLGLPNDLNVFTWRSPRLQTDLRHELTHALLHGTLKGVPLWLDEGLAGFFEQPPANDGVNPLHLDALRTPESDRGAFLPDMARLEKLTKVGQMGRGEYQEAWAWVHYMLRNSATRPVLLEHLQALRSNTAAGPLQPKLEAAVGDTSVALRTYLAKLDTPRTVPAARVRTASAR